MCQYCILINIILNVTELRPLREKVQEVTNEYDEKKKVYDRTAAALDSGAAKLEQVRNILDWNIVRHTKWLQAHNINIY